jgi:hypothetical protein
MLWAKTDSKMTDGRSLEGDELPSSLETESQWEQELTCVACSELSSKGRLSRLGLSLSAVSRLQAAVTRSRILMAFKTNRLKGKSEFILILNL